MQPQASGAKPDYNFIMQDGQQPKRRLGLPAWSGKTLIILAVVIIVILIIIVAAASKDGGGNGRDYIGALARGQEIIRVSSSVNQLATDAATQNLSATVQNSLSSEQAQLTSYLSGQKIKISTAQLNADKNSATDTQMQTATTNGNLASVYDSYLKTQLATYANDLKTAYQNTGPHGQAVLSDAYNSVQTLLQTAPLKSST